MPVIARTRLDVVPPTKHDHQLKNYSTKVSEKKKLVMVHAK
jgi:hypothetical protein